MPQIRKSQWLDVIHDLWRFMITTLLIIFEKERHIRCIQMSNANNRKVVETIQKKVTI